MRALNFCNIGLLFLLCLFLQACGHGGNEIADARSGGKSAPQGLSPGARCLHQHPALQVSAFPDAPSAVKAFFQATVDCGPSESEVDAYAAWSENRGIRIQAP